ncbi:putative DMT superfamily transporter inner membrane protein [Shimia sp. SK013]|uniref:DMT family transporter n=1 Tax=Shimia sp. SK013 TaxID=1389006 RepID=UPI0006B4AEA2|nr:DMT family transporter [Shimia sp. SK013]KPA22043.1 putative DMT superfamily transporter inner membrane protein [Shimia sp. SK013]
MTRLRWFGILLAIGAGWGLTQPLTKIAVSQGYQPLGLIFWQLAIGAVFMFVLRVVTGKPIALPPRLLWFFLLIAALGTVVPNSFSFRAAAQLPAGIMSLVISLVPMLAFPVALALGVDRFNWLRLGGLVLGLCGVYVLSEPEALPDPAMLAWLPIAVIAPLCYALEGNVVSKWGMHGLGAGHVLYGASIVGAIVALPLAVASGQFIDPRTEWAAPEYALVLSSIIHVSVYTAYVWLVTRAGSVFAAQVAYVVTGSGVIWSMLMLGERYSLWVWGAMGLILMGMFLVQPRDE